MRRYHRDGQKATGIRPIETTYKGVRFRSRLEARWAVLWDTLGVRWFYEHEGYQLPSGWYLPDFWIPPTGGRPNSSYFTEIKPTDPDMRARCLCRDLSVASGSAVHIMVGPPGIEQDWFYCPDGSERVINPRDFDDCMYRRFLRARRHAEEKANAYRFWEGGTQ